MGWASEVTPTTLQVSDIVIALYCELRKRRKMYLYIPCLAVATRTFSTTLSEADREGKKILEIPSDQLTLEKVHEAVEKWAKVGYGSFEPPDTISLVNFIDTERFKEEVMPEILLEPAVLSATRFASDAYERAKAARDHRTH